MTQVALELQPCCGKRSGIGTYTYELARRLHNRKGLEYVGNIFNFWGRNDNNSSLIDISMPIRIQKSMPYGVYRRIWNKIPIPYSMMFPRADINIFFNYIVPPRISGKVITTIHDLTYLRYPETMDRKNLKRIEQDIHSSIERSDHILVVSEFTKLEVIELLGVSEKKISVVYNAPSVSDETIPFQQVLEKFLVRRPYLLYVGTIEPRKNITRLIHAYECLKKETGIPHQLVLAGGMGWNTERIQTAIDQSLYREEIVLTGYVSGIEKNTLYSNADLFLFPSLYEGFGIPPLEAMHFGCPVVCANVASIPEVVGDAAELVNPFDSVSIADGIWKVLSDKEYAKRLSQCGYEQEKKFTWNRSANQLEQLCQHILE